jgi:ADP-heptose:LPS heptosyltransferase
MAALFEGLTRVRLHARGASKSLRTNARELFGRTLARLTGPRTGAVRALPHPVASILVCRINGRMGNTMFLTPLIHRLHQLCPSAVIDVAVSFPRAEELLRTLPGVRRVIAFPHKGPTLVQQYLRAVRTLRAQRYDVVIDPVPHSTSGRIALSLCRARARIGWGTYSQWAPLTHAVPEPPGLTHQAILPVMLVDHAFAAPHDPRAVRLSLNLPEAELKAGRAALAAAVNRPGFAPEHAACGFFAHATAFKAIAPEWWQSFWHTLLALEPDLVPVEFLPTADSAPLDTRFASLHLRSPRAVAAAMAATRMLISADAGPMHLASSTQVPTVALFRATNPALYGPLKPDDLVIDVTQCSAQRAAQLVAQVWRLNDRDRAA